MKLSIKKHCTCDGTDDKHYLHCDLMYFEGKSRPVKKKRFFFFYPMKVIRP